ncbi:hypothetical protein [Brevifollis gellanilyticus]|uniref:Uncharacterized protein n=1 Tax=Brevifollis gellanilyticus TaxID=748831 RepID=A0A512MFN9_9BACT|nr:hypothetical protein [Brevifollis gellanilyticus]GEP45516.1 hypothetical protein BGE01nite_48070 [Brevifollis gellanilyticus]
MKPVPAFTVPSHTRRSALLAGLALLASLSTPVTHGQGTPPVQPLPSKKPDTDAKVWGALVFASNDPKEAASMPKVDVPPEFADIPARLGKVFPYKHIDVIGQHLQDVFREYESWVVPTKDLFLKVDSKGPAKEGGMNLHLQFWRDQQVIVKTDAVLKAETPLFIAGPKWRGGQLLFVLVLQKGS